MTSLRRRMFEEMAAILDKQIAAATGVWQTIRKGEAEFFQGAANSRSLITIPVKK